jgi:lactate permease
LRLALRAAILFESDSVEGEDQVYEQIYEPVAGSLVFSTIVAAIPILVLFALLAGLRLAAQWASLVTLAVALVISVVVYRMPIGLALDATLLGVCFGLFPIVWIVINTMFPKYKDASVAI